MTDFTIVLGTRIWSTWSMRPWLALRRTGASFEEVVIELRRPDTRENVLAVSPSGFVPLLIDRRSDTPIKVWDSLAIAEYLAESFPEAGLWPSDPAARAVARSVSAEMHSGFRPMRMAMPMDLFAHLPGQGIDSEDVAADIRRIDQIFCDCRTAYGQSGPYLFGHFTIADAMFAPVVSRFRTYEPALTGIAARYVETMLADDGFIAWEEAARRAL
ncbi:glutathione S-transferase family protein [Kaistia dalseonensis]|uniref:Glutathione S-transferase n=1 Tax=Kaistia dalseonensis TaxID=410840 RepID=A0ABU0H642_9HYPH|nr:glutathione S-transferase family protein [Kaistia dalseonensis]MCX5495197.1 glutathione S-transferase family protein [Kaistia dalseonensis]MDQ0437782.1 glutathione S-transferase [Kaistia dalseonensis]